MSQSNRVPNNLIVVPACSGFYMRKNKEDASGKEKLKPYSQDRRKILKFVQKLRKVKKGCR